MLFGTLLFQKVLLGFTLLGKIYSKVWLHITDCLEMLWDENQSMSCVPNKVTVILACELIMPRKLKNKKKKVVKKAA